MTPQTELVHVPNARVEVVRAEDFMPLFTIEQALAKKQMQSEYINKILVEAPAGTTDGDYGKMPGGGAKKILFKPGAEKMCSHFGLNPSYSEDKIIEDWTGAEHGGEPLFYYSYRCQLSRGGRFMGEAIGSCNSWESKYRYRWVREEDVPAGIDLDDIPVRPGTVSEFAFAVDKAETSGYYGKPAEYWAKWKEAIEKGEARRIKRKTSKGKEMDAWEMGGSLYRIPNPEVPDTINTCQKMAQKRALVAAVLVVTNCSDAFTQDIEDFQDSNGNHIEPPAEKQATPANLPPEIEALFVAKVEPGATGRAFEFVKRALMDVLPQNGEEEYKRILEHNGLKPGKGNQLGPSRNAVMQCWTQAQSLKRLQKPDLGVSMNDMPHAEDRSVPDDDIPF